MDEQLDAYLDSKYAELNMMKVMANLEARTNGKPMPFPEFKRATDQVTRRAMLAVGARHVIVSWTTAAAAVIVLQLLGELKNLQPVNAALAGGAAVMASGILSGILNLIGVRQLRRRSTRARAASNELPGPAPLAAP